MSHTAFIALGTNLGDRPANLGAAIAAMAEVVLVVARSSLYETEPWGYLDQPAFLNMVLQVETEITPTDLLSFLKTLESTLGRTPSFRNGPRLIDLDIIFYDDLVLRQENLVIPHPRLHERAFVLVPLLDLAPDLIHPVLQRTVRQMAELVDKRGVVRFSG